MLLTYLKTKGLDETKAIYEWNYKKQLLHIQAGKRSKWESVEADISKAFSSAGTYNS